MRVFQVWTLRDGRVVNVTRGHRDRTEALEAAGLPPLQGFLSTPEEGLEPPTCGL
jgi:hypothetical protein